MYSGMLKNALECAKIFYGLLGCSNIVVKNVSEYFVNVLGYFRT